MIGIKADSSLRAMLIGDVVGSRRSADRSELHRAVTGALAQVADGAVDPPQFTVGDEFQGSYPTVGAAIDAALARPSASSTARIRASVSSAGSGRKSARGTDRASTRLARSSSTASRHSWACAWTRAGGEVEGVGDPLRGSPAVHLERGGQPQVQVIEDKISHARPIFLR